MPTKRSPSRFLPPKTSEESIPTAAHVNYVVFPHPKLIYDITKLTGATDHLKHKCPQKEAIERGAVAARNPNATTGADENVYHEKLRAELLQLKKVARPTVQEKRKPKVVSF
jgi:hypothetical protein